MTRFGIALDPELELPIGATARLIESLGVDYLATGEHMSFRRATGNGFITLSIAAGATTRIGLVSSITLLPLYPALVAAKMAAELARHSGGRFELGVGAGGDFPPEFDACGIPLPQRQARADEALEVLRRLWREERVTFSGRFTTLDDIALTPRPTPPPPVWVAGRKQRAMARAARHGDVWMPYMYTLAQLARSVETVREMAHENGRDPSSIAMGLYTTVCLGDSRGPRSTVWRRSSARPTGATCAPLSRRPSSPARRRTASRSCASGWQPASSASSSRR